MATPRRRAHLYRRWPIWLVYLVLLMAGVPWYWPEDQTTLVWGMPLWALVSFVTAVVTASFTAWLLLCHWPGEEDLDV